MAPIEKRREVLTDLLRKRIADAKAKPLERKQEERVIRKKLASRERAVVVAKARAKEVVLSRFHKEYVKKPLKAIEREMSAIKEKIKYLEGQRKKVKAKGKVTLESNIRALNARLSVLGNIRKEVLIKSAKSKAPVRPAEVRTPELSSKKQLLEHQPEPQAVERRREVVAKGQPESPRKEKIGIGNIQTTEQAISAIDGLIDRAIRTEQSADLEAVNRALSQFSLSLEAKINGVLRRFAEKRVSLDELNTYYVSIDSILRKAYSREDKVQPLGRLELIKRKLEEILFPKEKPKIKGVTEELLPETTVAAKASFDLEKALAELRSILLDVRKDVKETLAKVNSLCSGKDAKTQQTIITEVVNFALRTNNVALLRSVEVTFNTRFQQLGISIRKIIETQHEEYGNILNLLKGMRKGAVRDRNKIVVQLQELSKLVREVKTESTTKVLAILSELKTYFETDAFKEIIKEVVKDANKTSNVVLLTEINDRFESIVRDIEGVAQATVKAVRDSVAAGTKELRVASENLLKHLTEEGKVNKEEIIRALEEINNLILDKSQNDAAALGEIKNELLKLEDFFEPKAFEKYLTQILENAFANERPQLVSAIMDEFEKKYPDLTDLKARFDAVETLVKTVGDEVRAEVRKQAHILYTWLKRIDAKVTPIDQIAKQVEGLSKFFDPATYEKFLQDALLPGIREAIEKDNKTLYRALAGQIGNKYTLLRNLIKSLSDREEKRFNKIKSLLENLSEEGRANKQEILEELYNLFNYVADNHEIGKDTLERVKKLEAFFEPDAYKNFLKTILEENNATLIEMMKNDPFFKDKIDKAYIDTKFEEITKLIEEEKEKKPAEEKKGEGFGKKWEAPTAGTGIILLIIALLVFLIIQALRNSGGGPSGGIPSTAVVPVIGETAKAAAGGGLSSILGPLGGINPIIIILILVALFLLFPKK